MVKQSDLRMYHQVEEEGELVQKSERLFELSKFALDADVLAVAEKIAAVQDKTFVMATKVVETVLR